MPNQNMTINFLDSRLLSDIRNHLTLRTIDGIQTARQIDTPTHTVSALLVFFNQVILQGQPYQKTVDSVYEDIKLLDKFYKKAETDTQFLISHKLTLVIPFCSNTEYKLSQALPFIWFLQQNLGNADSVADKDKLRDSIFDMVAQFQIEKGNPLVIAALAALYGHKQARKIIKPEKIVLSGNVELSDAQLDLINLFFLPDMISLYAKQIWHTTHTQATISCALTTSNTELNQFVETLGVFGAPIPTETGSTPPECEFGMDLSPEMFPDIVDHATQMNTLVQMLSTG